MATGESAFKAWGQWFLLLVTVPITVLLLLIMVEESVGAATESLSVEAERMAGAGKVFRDRTASNNSALLFDKNRKASKRFIGSVQSLSVRVRGEGCRGAPRMLVQIDGRSVMLRRVTSERRWSYQRAVVKVPNGGHTLTVSFVNDRTGRSCDRDLEVDKTVLNLVQRDVVAPPRPEVKPTCTTSLQARVNAASPGAVVEAPGGCIYRETVTIDKPLTLEAGSGAEIRGSDVWGEWSKLGAYWVSRRSVPAFEAITEITDPQHPYPCKDGTSRCKWPEQVFIDGRPLLQVASRPQSGQFAVTDSRRVILAGDPTGHKVEVTVRDRWVVGRSEGVTIEGFTMKHAANGLNTAAIKNNGYPNWTVKDNDLSYAHTTVLSLGDATGLRMEGNDVHHGGLMGISSSSAGLEAINNEIHDNNTEAFFPGWKSAGIKVANASRFVASGNEVYNNDHNGIWTDVGSENVTISNNRVHHNTKRGIHIEISDHAEVFGNAVWENGWGTFVGEEEGVGISAVASRDVEIYNNTLAWNASGVTVVNSKRETGVGGDDPKYDTVSNVRVHNNTILTEERTGLDDLALVWRKAYAEGNIYEPAANNHGYDNRYWYTAAESSGRYRFVWDGRYAGISGFNPTPGEEQGHYLSSAQKTGVVRAKDIPASPSH